MLRNAASLRREHRTRELHRISSGKVLSGPFTGMTLSEHSAWGDGDRASKLLGSYELSLEKYIVKAVDRQPDVVINVGCAEGYYAVGLARLLPNAMVYAFDIDTRAQGWCSKAAEKNGVGERVVVGGLCTVKELSARSRKGGRTLVVMDCEGAEFDLLDPVRVPELCCSDILVETHDFITPGLTEILQQRFAHSHDVTCISQGARDPNSFAIMNDWSELERYLVLSEDRPSNMKWLACWSRCSASDRPV